MKHHTSHLNRDIIFSRVLLDLVNDRETRNAISRVVSEHRALNDEEHRRLSDRQIRRMLAGAIAQENPRLTLAEAEALLERRMEAAMKPYSGSSAPKAKPVTGRDLARAERKQTVRRGREGRR